MMRRCYSADHKNYNVYGERGVVVCDEWHDPNAFIDWHDQYYIYGWKMDKDILGGLIYSPECCVFIPHLINTFFVFKSLPTIERRGKKYSVSIKIKCKTIRLSGDTEDVLEQFYLFKELYLEKLVWEMKEEHKKLCIKYPNTPQISPKLLSILENFSTQEYLERKSGVI